MSTGESETLSESELAQLGSDNGRQITERLEGPDAAIEIDAKVDIVSGQWF